MVDRINLNYLATKLRREMNINEDGYFLIDDYLKMNNHLTLVYYPFSKRISGICIRNDKTSVIAINSTMSLGRQRFSFGHELYHLIYGEGNVQISNLIEESDEEIEEAANYFSSCLLIPYQVLMNELEGEKITKKKLIELEDKYGISHSAMLFRLKIDNLIGDNDLDKLKIDGIRSCARQYGYKTNIYEVPNINNKKTYGCYIEQVNELQGYEMLSEGRRRELLLKAFREDLIYKNN